MVRLLGFKGVASQFPSVSHKHEPVTAKGYPAKDDKSAGQEARRNFPSVMVEKRYPDISCFFEITDQGDADGHRIVSRFFDFNFRSDFLKYFSHVKKVGVCIPIGASDGRKAVFGVKYHADLSMYP
jgi:hypothetical protein